MEKGITVCVTGANVDDTARVLLRRLVELGGKAERIDDATVARLGGPYGATHACDLLARNGVVVVITCSPVRPEGDLLEVEVSEHDTPDFAAEKILDDLAEAGVVDLESVNYTPEEEERIRARLAKLGYIE